MSTRRITLSSAAWSAVTLTGENEGAILMARGDAVFTHATEAPTGSVTDTPIAYDMHAGDRTEFNGETIYGRAISSDALVDVTPNGDTFAQGRTYRVDIPFTIPQGQGGEVYLKYEIGTDIDLTSSVVEVTAGGVEFTAWAGAQGSGEAGLTDPVIVYPRNSKSNTPTRATQMTVSKGDSADGATLTLTGTANTHTPVMATAGGSAKGSTVSGEQTTRGFPATTAYVRLQKLDITNVETTGVLKQEWTEYD